ncbi:hypothetical protein [Rhodococcus qingshengii]|jgi:hypothetical protein|nr:hypothetical protein AWH04_09015 [Rhodococcus erythropolis]
MTMTILALGAVVGTLILFGVSLKEVSRSRAVEDELADLVRANQDALAHLDASLDRTLHSLTSSQGHSHRAAKSHDVESLIASWLAEANERTAARRRDCAWQEWEVLEVNVIHAAQPHGVRSAANDVSENWLAVSMCEDPDWQREPAKGRRSSRSPLHKLNALLDSSAPKELLFR